MGAGGWVALGGFQPAHPAQTICPSEDGVDVASGQGSSPMSSGRATQAHHAKWGGAGRGQGPHWGTGGAEVWLKDLDRAGRTSCPLSVPVVLLSRASLGVDDSPSGLSQSSIELVVPDIPAL